MMGLPRAGSITIAREGIVPTVSNKDLEKLELPYTVIGHSSLGTPSLHIALTGKGIKAIAAQVEDDDTVHINQWADVTEHGQKVRHYGNITVRRAKNEK